MCYWKPHSGKYLEQKHREGWGCSSVVACLPGLSEALGQIWVLRSSMLCFAIRNTSLSPSSSRGAMHGMGGLYRLTCWYIKINIYYNTLIMLYNI